MSIINSILSTKNLFINLMLKVALPKVKLSLDGHLNWSSSLIIQSHESHNVRDHKWTIQNSQVVVLCSCWLVLSLENLSSQLVASCISLDWLHFTIQILTMSHVTLIIIWNVVVTIYSEAFRSRFARSIWPIIFENTFFGNTIQQLR